MLPTTEDVLRALRQDLENAPHTDGGAGWDPPTVRCRVCLGRVFETPASIAAHVEVHANQFNHAPVTWWGITHVLHRLTVVAPLEKPHPGAGNAYARDVKYFVARHRDAAGNRYEPRIHEIVLDFIFQHQELVVQAGFPMRRVKPRHPCWLIDLDAYKFMLEIAATHPSGPSVHRLDEMTALIKVFRAMKEQRREAA
jgi:hypothetical protein